MLSGMAVWGGAGWLLDRWLGIEVFLPVGIILGVAVSIYMVVVKYGGPLPGTEAGRTSKPPGGRRSRPRTQKGQR
jgi:F0F1-type ATP synthase assembly protein I